MDRYRGKVKIGGSDLAAEAAPEEEAALDSDLNDQTFRLRHVTVYTALERFILGIRRNGRTSIARMITFASHTTRF